MVRNKDPLELDVEWSCRGPQFANQGSSRKCRDSSDSVRIEGTTEGKIYVLYAERPAL